MLISALMLLAGQLTALTLNIAFDDYDPEFGPSPVNLKHLLIPDPLNPTPPVHSPIESAAILAITRSGDRLNSGQWPFAFRL